LASWRVVIFTSGYTMKWCMYQYRGYNLSLPIWSIHHNLHSFLPMVISSSVCLSMHSNLKSWRSLANVFCALDNSANHRHFRLF
jgi:hypothetical protein